jgi:hypothetical protein
MRRFVFGQVYDLPACIDLFPPTKLKLAGGVRLSASQMSTSGLVLEVAHGLARLLLGVESLVKVAYIKYPGRQKAMLGEIP